MQRGVLNNDKKRAIWWSLTSDQLHFEKENSVLWTQRGIFTPPLHLQSYGHRFSFRSPLLQPPKTSLEPPSMRVPYTTFHFPFYHFLLPIPHISTLLPLFFPPSLPPSLLLPGAPCGSCHNRRWNGFICSNVVWAAAWHGTERHFIPVHWASLPLFLSLCAVHVFSNRPINTTQLWWPLFTSPSHNLCSQYVCKKATSHFSLSHTYTLLSLVANSQCHTAAIFFIFSSPLHFVVSFLHFFLYKPPCIFISLFFCLVSVYFVDSLLILSSANLYPSPFPSQQSQLLVISLPLGFIKLKPSTPSQPPASIKMWNDLSQGWKK